MKPIITTAILLLLSGLFSLQASATYNIIQPGPVECDTIILGSPTMTPNYCFDCTGPFISDTCTNCKGTVLINLIEGSNCDLRYGLQGSAYAPFIWQDSPYFEGLCHDDYLVVAQSKTDSSMFAVTTTQVWIGQDSYIEDLNMSCKDGMNAAQVDISMIHGHAPFTTTYISEDGLSNSYIADMHDFNFLIQDQEPGNYQFIIEDKYGCVQDTTINFTEECINPNEIILATPTVTASFCGNCNGVISVNLEQGMNQDLEYSIDAGTNWQNSNTFENLCSDDYLFGVRSKSETNNYAIGYTEVPVGQELLITAINMACETGSNQAKVSMNILYGQEPYMVNYTDQAGLTGNFSTFDNSSYFLIDNPTEGTYHFTIEDQYACAKDTMINLTESCINLDQIILVDPILTGVYCGTCNGTITVIIEQGLIQETEYSIDAGFTWHNSNFFANLCVGDFIIQARNKFDHSNIDISTAQIAAGPDLKILDLNYTCLQDENTAQAIMELTGGTASYKLTYIDPMGYQSDTIEGFNNLYFDIENITEGGYHFTVEDRFGCVKDSMYTVQDDCSNITMQVDHQITDLWNIRLTQLQEESLDIQIEGLYRNENTTLKIFNAQGQLVLSRTIVNQKEWNDQVTLQTGTYIILVQSTSGKNEVRKYAIF